MSAMRMNRHVPLAIAAAVAAVLFFALPPLGRAGVWDPHELRFAEVARRVALHSFGRTDLAVAGADDAPVHARDLARPAMPYVVSVA